MGVGRASRPFAGLPPLTLIVLLACGDAGGPPASAVARTDSAGVEIVTNRVAPADLSARHLGPEPVLEIRGNEASGATLLEVADVVPLAHGGVVVGVGGGATVHLFAEDGTLRASMGGEGDGPGELGTIGGVLPVAPDSLAVWDRGLGRLTVYHRSGEVGRVEDLRHLAGAGDLSSLHPLRDGFALVRHAGFGQEPTPGIQRNRAPSFRLDASGDSVGFYGRFPGTEVARWEGAAGSPLFGALLTVATRRDRLVIGLEKEAELREIGPDGRSVRVIRWADHPREVTGQEADAWVEEAVATLPEAQRPAVRQMLARIPAASVRPAYRDLVSADDGTLWLGDYPGHLLPQAPPPARRWTRIDSTGAFLDAVPTPAGFRLMAVARDRAWGVFVDEMGRETVRAYALP